MPPAAPDQPASAADERPDVAAPAADAAAAGSRSLSLAPNDAGARPARATGAATSTRKKRAMPRERSATAFDPTHHRLTGARHSAEVPNPSFRHLHGVRGHVRSPGGRI